MEKIIYARPSSSENSGADDNSLLSGSCDLSTVFQAVGSWSRRVEENVGERVEKVAKV